MIRIPRLKSQFRFVAIAHDTCALVSEVSEHLLFGVAYPLILKQMDGLRTMDEIAGEVSDVLPLEQAYYYALLLERRGFVEENQPADPERTAFWQILGGDPERAGKGLSPVRVRLIALGGTDPETVGRCIEETPQLQIVEGGSADDCLRVVLTSDYLDPELEEINHQALLSGRPWVLFKPGGVQPWIGPLFRPGRTGCWSCMAERLRCHRSVESLDQSKGFLRLSIGRTGPSVSAAAALLAADLLRLHGDCEGSNLEGTVLSLDFRTLELRRHSLFRLPYCPACGAGEESAPLDGLPEGPLLLQSRKKSGYRDGGHRIRPSEETLKVMQPHISPICGLIGKLLPISTESLLFGHLYQATYAVRRTPECYRKEKIDIRGVSNGKGHGVTQAKVSAAAEAMERFNALPRDGDPVVRAALKDLEGEAIPPRELLLLSERQWMEHRENCRRQGLEDPYDPSTTIDWTPCWSVGTGRWSLAPYTIVHHPLPEAPGIRFYSNGSNGLASGNCREEAVLHGVFEVVEREALALWWYNRLCVRAVDVSTFGDPDVLESVSFLEDRGWDLQILDLTTDMEIPVLAGVALHRTDEEADFLLGSGAHFDVRIALRRAIGEVAQAWHGAHNLYGANAFCVRNGLLPIGGADFLRPHPEMDMRPADAFEDWSSEDLLTDIHLFSRLLGERGLDLLVADIGRPEVPLKTVRVLVPGMRPIHPHFAEGRLYEVPVSQGRLARRQTEGELNPVPFVQCLNRSWEDPFTSPQRVPVERR